MARAWPKTEDPVYGILANSRIAGNWASLLSPSTPLHKLKTKSTFSDFKTSIMLLFATKEIHSYLLDKISLSIITVCAFWLSSWMLSSEGRKPTLDLSVTIAIFNKNAPFNLDK